MVAAVVFWGVAPPAWFFVEYLQFDLGAIEIPINNACSETSAGACAAKAKESMLKDVKAYGDMAFRIWAAVGALLAGAITSAAKRSS